MSVDATGFERLVRRVREQFPTLRFEMLEIGAVPLGGKQEPFHRLLDDFPGSRVHAFEIDPAVAMPCGCGPGLEWRSTRSASDADPNDERCT